MATEIEHKYLVKKERWKNVTPEKSAAIRQGYLLRDGGKTIRVRTLDKTGFLTIKGKSKNASRDEYEFEIPYADAVELLQKFCSRIVEKTRHYVMFENKTWEVDEFHGENAGLLMAEIELESESEKYGKPDWVDADVTFDNRYSNSSLAAKPFSTW